MEMLSANCLVVVVLAQYVADFLQKGAEGVVNSGQV